MEREREEEEEPGGRREGGALPPRRRLLPKENLNRGKVRERERAVFGVLALDS